MLAPDRRHVALAPSTPAPPPDRTAAVVEALPAVLHDTNGYLTTALMSAGWLTEQLADSRPDLADDLAALDAALLGVRDLVRGVRDLLDGDLSDGAPRDGQTFTLETLVAHSVPVCRAVAKKGGHTLSVDAPNTTAVRGDPRAAARILVNFVQNAAQAAEAAGGRITCTVYPAGGASPVAGPEARFSRAWGPLEDTRAMCCVAVEDEGPGLPAVIREGLFTARRTTKPTGHGIGLTGAAALAHAMGGRLGWVDRPGGGTVMALFLRVAAPAPERLTPRSVARLSMVRPDSAAPPTTP